MTRDKIIGLVVVGVIILAGCIGLTVLYYNTPCTQLLCTHTVIDNYCIITGTSGNYSCVVECDSNLFNTQYMDCYVLSNGDCPTLGACTSLVLLASALGILSGLGLIIVGIIGCVVFSYIMKQWNLVPVANDSTVIALDPIYLAPDHN